MVCNKCGVTLPDTVTFCTNCGAPTANARIAGAPTTGVAPPPMAANNPAQPLPQYQAPVQPASPWLNVPPQSQQNDGKAVGSLISGILAFTIAPLIAAIPAVVLGHMALSNIKKSAGRLKGEGMAVAGLVLGYLNLAAIPLILIIAAIAIPNLLRAKQTANMAAGASTVRTLNTTQVTYSTIYGTYARDLATLGPGPSSTCPSADPGSGPSAKYACLLDSVLGNSKCTGEEWCTKDAYKYNIQGVCDNAGACTDYVTVGTPVNESAATRSFCSTSDSIVRFKEGLVPEPPSVTECQTWQML
jgi:type II secretory pathway pseudopilin PulG